MTYIANGRNSLIRVHSVILHDTICFGENENMQQVLSADNTLYLILSSANDQMNLYITLI